MELEDKTIVCEDCGADFTHSAEDQERYLERGFTNDPKRCRDCREKRKAQQQNRGGGHHEGRGSSGGYRGGGGQRHRESFDAVCASCGIQTTVPFKPVQGRPVYCRDCYRTQRRE